MSSSSVALVFLPLALPCVLSWVPSLARRRFNITAAAPLDAPVSVEICVCSCRVYGFFVRDMVESFEIEVPYVTTHENASDFLTKPMKSASRFRELRAIVMNIRD